jgi:hypothetical protein
MSLSKPLLLFLLVLRAPNGIRTRVTAVKGRCPRPLDDGDVLRLTNLTREKVCDQMTFIGTKKPLAAGFNGLIAILLNCVRLS